MRKNKIVAHSVDTGRIKLYDTRHEGRVSTELSNEPRKRTYR